MKDQPAKSRKTGDAIENEPQNGRKRSNNTWYGVLVVLILIGIGYLFVEWPGKVSYPSGSRVEIQIPPGAPEDFKRLKATLLKDVADLPGIEKHHDLFSIAEFLPDGATFPDGIAVTWPLAKHRDPKNHKTLSIIAYHPAEKKWLGTRELATIDPGGKTATGKVYHFSIYALVKGAYYPQETEKEARPAKLYITTESVVASSSEEVTPPARAINETNNEPSVSRPAVAPETPPPHPPTQESIPPVDF